MSIKYVTCLTYFMLPGCESCDLFYDMLTDVSHVTYFVMLTGCES